MQRDEEEANRFAAALLMPEEFDRLKKNALVMVERPVTGDAATSPDRFNAACRQIAESQTSKLMGTLLE